MNEPLRLAMIQAGETRESLAEKVGVDPKSVVRWVSARHIPHPRTRVKVAAVLGKDAEALFPPERPDAPWFRSWLDAERDAIALRSYQPLLVPGLLQTEAYARAVLTDAGLIAPEAVEPLVRSRLERQDILDRTPPPTLTAIVDECALRRALGGPDIMRGQLQHLITMVTERPRVRVLVVPATAGGYAGLNGPFVLATLKHRTLAYLDTQLAGETVDDPTKVSALLSSWESCSREALPHRQSVQLIKEIAETWI